MPKIVFDTSPVERSSDSKSEIIHVESEDPKIKNLLTLEVDIPAELEGIEVVSAALQGYINSEEEEGFVGEHTEDEGIYEIYFLLSGRLNVTRDENDDKFLSVRKDLLSIDSSSVELMLDSELDYPTLKLKRNGSFEYISGVVVKPGVRHGTKSMKYPSLEKGSGAKEELGQEDHHLRPVTRFLAVKLRFTK